MLQLRAEGNRNAPEIIFGKPEMSGDNAVGVALIGLEMLKKSGEPIL
jgi:N6-L-threonylcarbamoyladenine synthase